MHVTKRIDLNLLKEELAAAGIAVINLTHAGTDTDGELYAVGEDSWPAEMPAGSDVVVDAHDASKSQRTAAFETQEDAERLAIIAERAATDPAFAALAELTLGKQGVTT